MSIDVATLEHKIELVVAYCQQLRDQNQALRTQLAGVEAEKQLLTERMNSARERLEAMMERLPAE